MELYKKVYIKSPADLPKECIYALIIHRREKYRSSGEKSFMCSIYISPLEYETQDDKKKWVNRFDWYLQPIDITDEDIVEWAYKESKGGWNEQMLSQYISGKIEGAKAALRGEIKHIK